MYADCGPIWEGHVVAPVKIIFLVNGTHFPTIIIHLNSLSFVDEVFRASANSVEATNLDSPHSPCSAKKKYYHGIVVYV